jgi:hypothetical protein
MTRFPVAHLWKPGSQDGYAAFIAAVGFETRSRFISETFGVRANRNLACAFPDRKVHSFKDNDKWFRSAGFEVQEVSDEQFRIWFEGVLKIIKSTTIPTQRICIDISSLNRIRLATIIDVLRNLDWMSEIQVDFLYAIAEFSSPPLETAPNIHVGPVLASFAGWSMDPERPPVAIVGLGYEEDKALGAVEHIQAADVWVFVPRSAITQYDTTLKIANSALLESISESRLLTYRVTAVMDTFISLESLTHRILQTDNAVLFPFGPKIFALNSLLVACLHPRAAVWRVSTGSVGEASDRKPSGDVCGLTVNFLATQAANTAKAGAVGD